MRDETETRPPTAVDEPPRSSTDTTVVLDSSRHKTAFRRRVFAFLGPSTLVITYYIVEAWLKGQVLSLAINVGALACFVGAAWLVWRTRFADAGTHMLLVGGWLVLGCTSFSDGQVYSKTLWLLPLLPFAAAHLLGVRAAVIWAIVCALWIVAVYVIASIIVLIPEPGETELDGMVLRVVSLGLFTAFGVSARLLTQRQIQELERQRAELEVERERAEAAARAKSTFLANMSHEIRTPLNGILGMAEYLRDRELAAEDHEAAEIIDRCGHGLLTLLNDILDLSKLEAGKMEVEHIAFDLHQLADDACLLFRRRAHDKNLALDLRYRTQARWFHGDPTRIRQIIVNLVGNAIKFTECGKVELSVDASTNRDDGIVLRVTDTGPGIDPTIREIVFNEFAQGSVATNRLHGGTGLGLAITRRVVERLGGSIHIESRLGHGSSFIVELPLSPSTAVAPAASKSITPGHDARAPLNLHVLVVEDNVVNQRVLERMLDKLACTWELADDGYVAVDKAARGSYDVILMDMRLPGLDGFQATREIRSLEAPARNVPIVAVTANAFDSDREACLAAGMDAFLTKPVRQADLRTTLSSIASRRPTVAKDPGSATEPSSPTST